MSSTPPDPGDRLVAVRALDPVDAGLQFLFPSLWRGVDGSTGRRFVERFAPGAFAGRDAEVVALYGHERRTLLPLGSTQAGTLRLTDDGTGQAFEIDPPETAFARDLLALIARGDLRETSFAFALPEGDKGADEWGRGEGGVFRRTVHRAVLTDVSVVARGAYVEADLGSSGGERD